MANLSKPVCHGESEKCRFGNPPHESTSQRLGIIYGVLSSIALLIISIFIYPVSLYLLSHFVTVAKHGGSIIDMSWYSKSIEANLTKTNLSDESKYAILLALSAMVLLNAVNAIINIVAAACFYKTNRRIEFGALLPMLIALSIAMVVTLLLPFQTFGPPGPGINVKVSDYPVVIVIKLSFAITGFFLFLRNALTVIFFRRF
jgi:hypothetical protein